MTNRTAKFDGKTYVGVQHKTDRKREYWFEFYDQDGKPILIGKAFSAPSSAWDWAKEAIEQYHNQRMRLIKKITVHNMLWLDQTDRTLPQKLFSATIHYTGKYAISPKYAYVHPSHVENLTLTEDGFVEIHGLQIYPSDMLTLNAIEIGVLKQ